MYCAPPAICCSTHTLFKLSSRCSKRTCGAGDAQITELLEELGKHEIKVNVIDLLAYPTLDVT